MSETTAPETGVAESATVETPASPIVVNGLKIEVGIPVPDFQAGRGTGSKYDPVFEKMPVGGSIFFPGEDAEKQVGSLLRVAKKRGLRFITRKVTEDVLLEGEMQRVAGIRVWRRDGK